MSTQIIDTGSDLQPGDPVHHEGLGDLEVESLDVLRKRVWCVKVDTGQRYHIGADHLTKGHQADANLEEIAGQAEAPESTSIPPVIESVPLQNKGVAPPPEQKPGRKYGRSRMVNCARCKTPTRKYASEIASNKTGVFVCPTCWKGRLWSDQSQEADSPAPKAETEVTPAIVAEAAIPETKVETSTIRDLQDTLDWLLCGRAELDHQIAAFEGVIRFFEANP